MGVPPDTVLAGIGCCSRAVSLGLAHMYWDHCQMWPSHMAKQTPLTALTASLDPDLEGSPLAAHSALGFPADQGPSQY